jgi:hypothetical protein
MQNYLKTLAEETADYVIQGSEPLDPWEYVRVRNFLMASGDPLDLMLCAIILVGVSLFLREDEVSQISIDDLDFKLSIVSDHAVDSIGVWVQGKRDQAKVLLMLWANHANPQICPVRHLLCWLYVSRITSGYLFPPANTLNEILVDQKRNPQQNFNNIYQVDYSLVLDKVQTVFTNITARPGPFGTHFMRKTGFVLAIWGEGADIDIKDASRLKSLEMLSRYKKDGTTLMEAAKSNNKVPVIGRWRSCYVQNYHTSGKNFSDIISHFSKIYQLSRIDSIIALGEKISVQAGQRLQNCLFELNDSLCVYLSSSPSGADRINLINPLEKLLQEAASLIMLAKLSIIPAKNNQGDSALSLPVPLPPLPQAISFNSSATVRRPTPFAADSIASSSPVVPQAEQEANHLAPTPPAVQESITTDAPIQSIPVSAAPILSIPACATFPIQQSMSSEDIIIQRIQNSNDMDLPDRKILSQMKMKGEMKLNIIIELFKASTRLKLTRNANVFVSRTARPVYGCWVYHHNKSSRSFLESWGESFSYSRFSEECCTGLEDQPCAKSK